MIVEVAVTGNADFMRLLEGAATESWGFSAEALRDPHQVNSVYVHVPGNQDESLETVRNWLTQGALPGIVGIHLRPPTCRRCGRPMVLRNSARGKFWGC